MAVSRVYKILDEIIGCEVTKGKKIGIFPMGRVGMLARYILENKYACKGIYIDNKLWKSDSNVISFENYKNVDGEDVSLILATNTVPLNEHLLQELHCARIQAKILNVIDYRDNFVDEHMEEICSLCRVKKAQGYELVRVGPMHDGGYVMLDDFKDKDVAYSIGIAEEAGWDLDMAQRGCQVYCFDHTIENLPIKNKGLHFFKLGLSGLTNIGNGVCTLDTMLALNNHTEKKKMILKIDIEGAEWEFLQEVPTSILDKFSQITMELHGLLNEDYYERIITGLRKINETHQAVWIHANCVGGVQKYRNIEIPDLLEITFANKSEYEFVPIAYDCPIGLDCPNSGERDISLKGWGVQRVSVSK